MIFKKEPLTTKRYTSAQLAGTDIPETVVRTLPKPTQTTCREISATIYGNCDNTSFNKKISKIPRFMSPNRKMDTCVESRNSFLEIKDSGRVEGFTTSGTCAAYGQDSMAAILYELYYKHQMYLDPVPLNDKKEPNIITFYTTLHQSLSVKDRATLAKLVNLYARIPLILLEPLEIFRRFAKKTTPATKIKTHSISEQPLVGFDFPTSCLTTSYLYWWTGALLREAIYIFSSTHKIREPLIALANQVPLTRIINNHLWDQALDVWLQLKKILLKNAGASVDSSAWFIQDKVNMFSLFEKWVVSGGLVATTAGARYMNDDYKDHGLLRNMLQHLMLSSWFYRNDINQFKTHAGTAKGMRCWIGTPDIQILYNPDFSPLEKVSYKEINTRANNLISTRDTTTHY